MGADHRGTPGEPAAPPLVELLDIVKEFPGVRANDGVSLSVAAGEVHGLLGENGAGKSTLVSILYGLYQADSGSIRRNGREVRLRSPAEALRAGIAIVQQHFSLVPTLSVAENVVLGAEGRIVHGRRQLHDRIEALSGRYGLDLDPSARVATLSIGARQRVEILKCLSRDPEVLILDEPTTVLTPQEVDALFATVRSLAAEGRGIVLISHKLDELIAVTSRITVLREGRSVAVVATADVDPPALARLMIGREVRLRSTAGFLGLSHLPLSQRAPGSPPCRQRADGGGAPTRRPGSALRLRGVTVRDGDGVTRLRGIDLDVASGEVVGIAGVEGNGQRELVQVLAGTTAVAEGSVHLGGEDVTGAGPHALREAGLRVVTEDRHDTGIVLDMTVAENLVVDRIDERRFSRLGVVDRRAVDDQARRLVEEYRVATPSVHTVMRLLSGGNQQRAVLARELSRPVRVLVAAQPTRGLDVGAIEEVTDRILSVRDAGGAVLLISADLAELFSVADRVAVIADGRMTAPRPVAETSPADLGPLMAGLGHDPDGAAP